MAEQPAELTVAEFISGDHFDAVAAWTSEGRPVRIMDESGAVIGVIGTLGGDEQNEDERDALRARVAELEHDARMSSACMQSIREESERLRVALYQAFGDQRDPDDAVALLVAAAHREGYAQGAEQERGQSLAREKDLEAECERLRSELRAQGSALEEEVEHRVGVGGERDTHLAAARALRGRINEANARESALRAQLDQAYRAAHDDAR